MSVQSTFDGLADLDGTLNPYVVNASQEWTTTDCIATPSGVDVLVESCCMIERFDTCADNLGRRPIAQIVTFPFVERQLVARRRTPTYSRDDVRLAISGSETRFDAAVNGFKHHMQQCPVVSHVVEATTHRHMIINHTLAGLEQHFQLTNQNRSIRKKHLSTATSAMVRKSAGLSRDIVVNGRRVLKALPHFILRWWMSQCSHRLQQFGIPSSIFEAGPTRRACSGPVIRHVARQQIEM